MNRTYDRRLTAASAILRLWVTMPLSQVPHMHISFRLLTPLALILLLPACSGLTEKLRAPRTQAAPTTATPQPQPAAPQQTQAAPVRLGTGPASSAEALDTTSAAERQAAAAPAAGCARLGTTSAALGDPAEGGVWAETPLVTAKRKGRLEDPASGKSVEVELRPAGGPASGGTQVSLAAMRVLGVPLTALPELVVYGG
jgi:hypothetical protein